MKYIRFLSKKIKSYFYSCIINKCNIIMKPTKERYRIWSPYNLYVKALISHFSYPFYSSKISLSYVFHIHNFHKNPYWDIGDLVKLSLNEVIAYLFLLMSLSLWCYNVLLEPIAIVIFLSGFNYVILSQTHWRMFHE